MVVCDFCGNKDSLDSESFQVDKHNTGFWCEICEGYSYLDQLTTKHRFTLILENSKEKTNLAPPINVKLSKRISPYRYPGGKSKIAEYLFAHIQQAKTKKLTSPFTGGGSFELSMLDAGVIEKLHLNDLDTGIFSLWWTIKNAPYKLIKMVQTITPTLNDYFSCQSIIKADYNGVNAVEAAWSSLLVNRLAYSGIYKANPLGGRNGKQKDLLSRWNPKDLINRIEKISSLSNQFEITQENAVDLIEEAYWENSTTIFIDPPYVNKGKTLYHCYYTENNHKELAFLLDSLYFGFPGADIIVTYDYNQWIDNLYDYPDKKIIGRKYSA